MSRNYLHPRTAGEAENGYGGYQKSLYLSVESIDARLEYGEASSDDLSSDWDTENEEAPKGKEPKVQQDESARPSRHLLNVQF